MSSNYKKRPLKIYIQDIFRAKQSAQNKYVYELFGRNFKNVMLNGVVTAIYNTHNLSTNFELSDPTGSVQVYCNSTKNNNKITPNCLEDLANGLNKIYKYGERRSRTMSFMLNKIQNKCNNLIRFNVGDVVTVIGDIFVDDFRNVRMIAAYEWYITSVERDVIWMEELRYLYDKCYIKS